MSSPEEGDRRPFTEAYGTRINIGDPVVIVGIYKDPEEGQAEDIYANPESLPAVFIGEEQVTCEGEVLFDGEWIPGFEVLLRDGSTNTIWGFECHWFTPEEYAKKVSYEAQIDSSPLN